MHRRKADWMMDLRQAEDLERVAHRRGLEVDELVDEVLRRLGTPSQTITMRNCLGPQLDWLLAGKPLELAPYYERFYESAEYPFLTAHHKMPPQSMVSIHEFLAMAEGLDV